MLSNHTLLVFAAGVTAYAGVFHGALAPRLPASRWLAGWAAAATAFLLARTAQFAADDPASAIFWNRAYVALTPCLIWPLTRFVAELVGASPTRPAKLVNRAWVAALMAASLFTPWMIRDEATLRADLFGAPYWSGEGGGGLGLIAATALVGILWAMRALRRSRRVPPPERRWLLFALGLYAVLGVGNLVSSLRWLPIPGLVEFAPLAIVLATSRMAALRERQLEEQLASSIDDQAGRLRASEERYRSIIEHAPFGLAVCNRDGEVLTMTSRFRGILGLDEPGAITPRNLIDEAPPEVAAGARGLRAAVEHGRTIRGEIPYTTRGGRRLELRFALAPQRSSAGDVEGALVLVDDVTERRAIEARLRQSLKLEAIGQLAGGVASAVTLPMGAVRENLSAMESALDELRKQTKPGAALATRFAEIEQLLGESREGIERALAIVRDMGELSRGGAPSREAVDVNELLGSVVRMAATKRGAGIDLVARLAAVPVLQANPGQLRQVFLNLVVNALQAATARVELESSPARDGVLVRVRDDGAGIAREHEHRLFVPFFTTKPAGEGTGLGLFISYQIVQAHGGSIRGQNAPDGGAVFSVWLPCSGAPARRGA